ncbi:hypothetical protein [Paraburkholderia phenazinium]|uniref:hypothetical protein n=1 Tax=Paraburkholderia phenazinium TaxID=60549 RepID=UPI00117D247C|nr:hypothetical protein [Paraburkholderia phenazinium]
MLDTIFHDVPADLPLRARLDDSQDFPILAIRDFGTKGLGGPTRGNVVPRPGEPTNFVDFMRYSGRSPNRTHSGGTYGFGKAAYFLASSLRTICVHTRFSGVAGIESRFMASALGPQFETTGPDSTRYTGRHWWGGQASDGVVDPVVGLAADDLARLLDPAVRASDATGTTIYVLAPEFENASAEHVFASMARTIVEFFWPKLIDGIDGAPSMTFGVQWQGHDIALPVNEPQWALLSHAFLAASTGTSTDSGEVQSVFSQRPRQHLGTLALLRRPANLGGAGGTTTTENAEPMSGRRIVEFPLRHIALMRAPNFVVKYIEGPPAPYGLAEYAGVFRVDSRVDSAFARSEPPTHDDWVPDLLEATTERTYVRVAQRRVKELVEAFAAPFSVEPGTTDARSVLGFSAMLGGLVPSLHDDGGPSGSSSTGVTRRRPVATSTVRADFMGEPELALIDGVPAMLVRFEVLGRPGQTATVKALSRVMVADGFETEPPEGAAVPRVLAWRKPDGSVSSTQASCSIEVASGTWSVEVSIPSDAMTTLALEVEVGS